MNCENAKNAVMRISIKIARQPADGECLKVPVLIFPSFEPWCEFLLLFIGEHAYDR